MPSILMYNINIKHICKHNIIYIIYIIYSLYNYSDALK